jgi:hypothetical protein
VKRLFWCTIALSLILGHGSLAMSYFYHWPPELVLLTLAPWIPFSTLVYIRERQSKREGEQKDASTIDPNH